MFALKKDNSWKILVFCVIWYETEAATTTIELLPPRVIRNAGYLPPIANNAHNPVLSTKTYSIKNSRNIGEFNTRPQIKSAKSSSLSRNDGPFYTSYAPPPSGTVQYKNLQLPLSTNSPKIPLVISKSDYTKHPGFDVAPKAEGNNEASSTQMLMIEKPPSVILRTKHNKTIEAAKILASTLLEASGESPLESGITRANFTSNSTDIYIVKSHKNAYIIPSHLMNDVSKPSSVEDLLPIRNRFEKAYTINQFIFVIKPEKINFLNKLV